MWKKFKKTAPSSDKEDSRKPDKVTSDGVRIYVSPKGSFSVNTDDLLNSDKVKKQFEDLERVFGKEIKL